MVRGQIPQLDFDLPKRRQPADRSVDSADQPLRRSPSVLSGSFGCCRSAWTTRTEHHSRLNRDFGDEPRTLDLGPAAVRVLATTGAARSGAPVTIGAREATIFAVGRG